MKAAARLRSSCIGRGNRPVNHFLHLSNLLLYLALAFLYCLQLVRAMSGVYTKAEYALFLILSDFAVAKSFCSQSFPVAPVTTKAEYTGAGKHKRRGVRGRDRRTVKKTSTKATSNAGIKSTTSPCPQYPLLYSLEAQAEAFVSTICSYN